jgi:putative ABC transport system permease protein
MFRFAPYVLKTLWRHRTRTLLTVSGAAVALFVFSFVLAVEEGLDRLATDARSKGTLIAFQTNRFCPATSRLPEDYVLKVRRMEGVEDAMPIKVFTNNCRASLDVIVFHGVPADKLKAFREMTLTSGDWSEFERRQDGALVGSAVARRRGIAAGQKFSIGGVTVSVAGVFTAPTPAEEDFIYTHLDFLQRARGMNSVGTVTQFEVRLRPGADAEATAARIDDLFRGGPVATDTRPKGVFQASSVADLAELIRFADYLGYACVGLVLALVATTTVMSVQDRIREYGVLQTLGVSGPRIFRLVMAESTLLSVAGGTLGVGLATAALAWSRLSVGAEAVTIAFTPSLSLAVTGAAVSLAIGLLAGFAPAWQAARADIVTALRHV